MRTIPEVAQDVHLWEREMLRSADGCALHLPYTFAERGLALTNSDAAWGRGDRMIDHRVRLYV